MLQITKDKLALGGHMHINNTLLLIFLMLAQLCLLLALPNKSFLNKTVKKLVIIFLFLYISSSHCIVALIILKILFLRKLSPWTAEWEIFDG